MNILVTGGAGYIGSHMVLALLEAGLQPVVLDNLSTGFRNAVPAGTPFVCGNVDDIGLVSEIIRQYAIATVIHFAASTVVPESVAKPLDYYLNNTVATRSLLQTCVDEGVGTFIFSSTAAVYGDVIGDEVRETAAIQPISPYGASKAMSERILQDTASAYGMKYGILRYFNVAGADTQGRAGQRTRGATHLVKVAIQAALEQGRAISVFGTDYPTPDGTCIRDYIHVSDLVDAHLIVLNHLAAGHANVVVNCGYGHGHSVRDVLKVVEQEAVVKLNVIEGARRLGDAPHVVANNDLIVGLGWRPRHDDLASIVRSALDFELSTAKA